MSQPQRRSRKAITALKEDVEPPMEPKLKSKKRHRSHINPQTKDRA